MQIFDLLNTRTTKIIKMTNLEFFTEILHIFTTVYFQSASFEWILIQTEARILHCIINFLFPSFSFFCYKFYTSIVDRSINASFKCHVYTISGTYPITSDCRNERTTQFIIKYSIEIQSNPKFLQVSRVFRSSFKLFERRTARRSRIHGVESYISWWTEELRTRTRGVLPPATDNRPGPES